MSTLADLLRSEWDAGTDPQDYERGDPIHAGLLALRNGATFEEAVARMEALG